MNAWLEARRRHGPDVHSVAAAREAMRRRVEMQGDIEGTLARLDRQIEAAAREARKAAAELRSVREKAAKSLARAAEAGIAELGFEKAQFRIAITPGAAISWNKTLFPDPEDFLAKIHAEGLKTTLNLHPASGIEPWEKAYPAMARAMGIDPATRKYVPFNITDKKFATNYMDLVHHPLEKQGIDFWWLDWQQEQKTEMPGVMPTWWLNYVHFTDQQREGKRPLLFHRWGGLGNHRYQIGFSGDTVSVWDSLAFQPWFTATAANVGYAYWSHDIGGHMPGAVDPELFTRWVEFGAFSPILRTHTTKNPASERRVWAYPEPYSSVLRSTFQSAVCTRTLHVYRGAEDVRHGCCVLPAALLRLAGGAGGVRQQGRISVWRRDAGCAGDGSRGQAKRAGDGEGLAARG